MSSRCGLALHLTLTHLLLLFLFALGSQPASRSPNFSWKFLGLNFFISPIQCLHIFGSQFFFLRCRLISMLWIIFMKIKKIAKIKFTAILIDTNPLEAKWRARKKNFPSFSFQILMCVFSKQNGVIFSSHCLSLSLCVSIMHVKLYYN